MQSTAWAVAGPPSACAGAQLSARPVRPAPLRRIGVAAAASSGPALGSSLRPAASRRPGGATTMPPSTRLLAPRPPRAAGAAPGGPPYAAIAALAGAGALETAYLAWAKLAGTGVACPLDGGCESVLGSPYAVVFGVPLPLLGCAAYTAVAGLAAFHWAAGRSEAADDAQPSTGATTAAAHPAAAAALAAGAAALAATSASLVALLATRFADTPCAWCIGSAGLSAAIAAALFGSLPRSDLRAALAPGGSAALATVLALHLAWAGVDPSAAAAAADSLPYAEPEISRPSPPGAVGLARRLKAAGARMYGAFWCGHCFDQRQAFGAAAAAELPYVECYPDGVTRGGPGPAAACVAAGVQGFPSWVMPGGEVLEGEQTFAQLEDALRRGQARAALEGVLPRAAPELVGR